MLEVCLTTEPVFKSTTKRTHIVSLCDDKAKSFYGSSLLTEGADKHEHNYEISYN